MSVEGTSFSIVRLNNTNEGWGVVSDRSGALVHINGLALKLTRERAAEIAATLNDQAKDSGAVVDEGA